MLVIPMAGLSARFFSAGYNIPKYQLPLFNETLFHHSLNSFKRLFYAEKFIFIFRQGLEAKQFIEHEIRKLGIEKFDLVELPSETRGQAETVYLGTRHLKQSTPITIFNIDTIRPDFHHPAWIDNYDGYLEVFQGIGDHWSFIEPADNISVARTTEKNRISDLCSDGLYHFNEISDFNFAFETSLRTADTVRGEYYVAPLYNTLINAGKKIGYRIIGSSDILFSGTPEEYRSLLANNIAKQRLTIQS